MVHRVNATILVTLRKLRPAVLDQTQPGLTRPFGLVLGLTKRNTGLVWSGLV